MFVTETIGISLDVWESRREQLRPTPSAWNSIYIYLDVWESWREQLRTIPSCWNYIYIYLSRCLGI